MKKEELEKYVGELSPEMQEKARQCKDMQELNALLAENDVELSEEVLQAVAGGCTVSDKHPKGTLMDYECSQCSSKLKYWDDTYSDGMRMYCDNQSCVACREKWLFSPFMVYDTVRGNQRSTGGVKRVK